MASLWSLLRAWEVDQKLGTLHISQEYWTDNEHGSPGNCFPPRMISNLNHWHLFWWNQVLISRSWKGLNSDVWQYARESLGPDSLKEGALLLESCVCLPFQQYKLCYASLFLHFSCNYGRFYGHNESGITIVVCCVTLLFEYLNRSLSSLSTEGNILYILPKCL
jgi:hypothetical protein